MRTLLDVLDAADGSDAPSMVDQMAPADREALEVGLLLAEVERRLPNGWGVGIQKPGAADAWFAGISEHTEWTVTGVGATQKDALTALLEQLP